MKQKKWIKVIALLSYVFSTFYSLYLGRYESIYGLGVILVILIQALGVLVFLVTLFLQKFSFQKKLLYSSILVSCLQAVFILGHEIEQYKPTYYINIPSDYTGCVYLFVTNNQIQNVTVDENGMGYMGRDGKVNWEIKRGDELITQAFSTSQSNEILIRDSTNTTLIAYSVSCLEINDSSYYPKRPYDYEIFPCMDTKEFLGLIEDEILNEEWLRKKVWKGNGKEDSWVLDTQLSRL